MSTDNNKEVHLFPLDAIVSLDISGGFYTRLVKLLGDLLKDKSPEDILAIMSNLKEDKPADDTEYNLMTLIILINQIEKNVKEQNKFTTVKPSDYEKSDEDSN